MTQIQSDTFNQLRKDKAFALTLDITKAQETDNVFKVVIEKFGGVDVLVNNAGFAFSGAIEETIITETRNIFETNFFGTLQLNSRSRLYE